MGRIAIIFFVLLWLNTQAVFASIDTTLRLHEENFIEGSYSDFYIDNLNNIYLVNADNQIKKINDKGDSVAVSNALRKYGDIFFMDISNPLKILVYYKDFGTIIVLDRFLSNLNTIDLRKYGILQASAVALSYDNNYWVFDEVENKLKKMDDNGNTLLQTPDFRTVFNESFTPEKIIDYNGFVYLYNRKAGCLLFDYYGAFKQRVLIPDRDNIQVIKNDIYGFDTSHIYRYHLQTYNEASYNMSIPLSSVRKIQAAANNLFVLAADGLHIYSIN